MSVAPPIVRHAEALMRDIEEAVLRFPRRHRHVSGQELRQKAFTLAQLANQAWSKPSRRVELVERIEQFIAERLQLRLKDDVRIRPLSAGIDFLGYIVYPTHTRVRRRVLKHAHEALQAWHAANVRDGAAHATPAGYRRIASVWGSYQGHMSHASSYRLRERILTRQPWLRSLASTKRRFSHALEGRHITIKVGS